MVAYDATAADQLMACYTIRDSILPDATNKLCSGFLQANMPLFLSTKYEIVLVLHQPHQSKDAWQGRA